MDIIEKAKNYVLDKMANIPMSEATITDVDLKGFGLYGLTLLAKVSVSSHYSIPIPIGEIAFVVKSARRGIASGTIPDPRSLKANDLGGHGSFSNNQTLNNVVEPNQEFQGLVCEGANVLPLSKYQRVVKG